MPDSRNVCCKDGLSEKSALAGAINVDNRYFCPWCSGRMSRSEWRSHTCDGMPTRLRVSIREFARRNP